MNRHMIARIGLGWQVGVPSGWGTYGVNLSVQFARKGITPALFLIAPSPTLTEEQAGLLQPAIQEYARWHGVLKAGGGALDFPMLHALGDKLDIPAVTAGLIGRPDVGVVFFESAVVPPKHLEAAKRFALVVTGSGWNAEVLRRHGLDRVINCPQGVDLALFAPGPRVGRFAGRFVVFSGGKLEYRKGQDLVVAAFKRFHARHDDALLVTAWHNPWPAAARGLSVSPHVNGAPGVDTGGRLDVSGWLAANGLPAHAFVDLGLLANAATPPLLREVDVALFPNRCEGGTNLVAMECMATGVPVILSRNTGHLDLIADDNCYALDMQIPMGVVTGRADLDGWGESAIDEIVNRLEQAYTDRAAAQAKGNAAVAFMQSWSWSDQTDRFLAALKTVI